MISTVLSNANPGQKFQNIPFLLAQGQNNGQNALNKKSALFTLRAKTVFSPQDTPSQRAFGGIIRRFDALVVNKSPHGGFEFKNIGTGFAGRRLIDQHANLQQSPSRYKPGWVEPGPKNHSGSKCHL
jgi:hypothetical protein